MGKPDLPEKRPPGGPVSYLLSLKLAEIFGNYEEDEEDGRVSGDERGTIR